MQLSTVALLLSAITAPALGRPSTFVSRQADACTGLGDNAHATISGNITLSAISTSDPSASPTSIPLTLTLDTPSSRAQMWGIATVASVGSNEFANVILTDHGIKSADRPTQLVVTGPVSWGLVALLFTGNPGPPNPIFCAAPPKEEDSPRILALNGHTDLFQLCPRTTIGKNLVELFYNVTDPGCSPVEVQIVQV